MNLKTFPSIQSHKLLLIKATKKGKNIAFSLLYRGDVTPTDTMKAVSYIKGFNDINLVGWCPTGFKIGLCKSKPEVLIDDDISKTSKAVCLIKNSIGICERFHKNNIDVNLMVKRRAFLHWFIGEGMEEIEINEAVEKSLLLEKNYYEVKIFYYK